MIRASLTLVSALLCGGGCLPPDSGSGSSTAGTVDMGEPVVGKLKFKDRVVNLTPEVFADEQNGVPREATAKIIADIDLSKRQSDQRAGGESNLPERERVR
jgi:hypothetical protein